MLRWRRSRRTLVASLRQSYAAPRSRNDPPFITQLTGITNDMVASAPPAGQVMADAARFVGDTPLVAHNAGFDRRFWQEELARAGQPADQPFACTVLLSRRLYPDAPSHKLGSLIDWFDLPRTGQAHRALADAEMAAELLGRIRHDLMMRHGIARPDHAFLRALQACTTRQLPRFMAQHGRPVDQPPLERQDTTAATAEAS